MDERTELMTVDNIRNRVYTIRGEQVMLDYDLAELYGYEVKYLNRQVKRNINRFPDDFMFQVLEEELEILRCQNGTANTNNMSRAMPYAFTEQGIYMLAAVLRGELAEQQSIFIMRTFREMRHYIKDNQQFLMQSELNLVASRMTDLTVKIASVSDRQNNTEKRMDDVEKSINIINENFMSNKEFKEFVIYKNQKFEADVAYIDIYKQASKSIYVIDDYMNTKTLQLLSQKKQGVEVVLFTENGHGRKGFLTPAIVNDFANQYPPLCIKPNPDSHDRWIVLDYGLQTEQVYHCGASSKDAGKRVCAINKLENSALIHPVVDELLLGDDKTIG